MCNKCSHLPQGALEYAFEMDTGFCAIVVSVFFFSVVAAALAVLSESASVLSFAVDQKTTL